MKSKKQKRAEALERVSKYTFDQSRAFRRIMAKMSDYSPDELTEVLAKEEQNWEMLRQRLMSNITNNLMRG